MKENGFAIGLLIGTLVIGGGLVFFGVSQGKRYAGIQSEYSDVKSDVERMASVRPYPTEENLEARKTEVTAFRGKVEGLQNAMQSFRPEEMNKISASEFQIRLVAKTEAIKELFESKGVGFPEQFAFGMESYLDALPKDESTAKLNYQLEATEWLFRQLVTDETYMIRNVVRESLPSEAGKDWKTFYEDEDLPLPLAQSLPMEIVFLAREAEANEFINSLVTSKKYFFVVDMVQMGNESKNPPVRSQSGLEENEEGGGGEEEGQAFGAFGSFNFGAEEEAEAEEEAKEEKVEDEEASVVEEGLILGQVLGSEGVYVGLQIRLLLFDEAIELPEFK